MQTHQKHDRTIDDYLFFIALLLHKLDRLFLHLLEIVLVFAIGFDLSVIMTHML